MRWWKWLSRRWSEKWELKSLRQTLNTSFYSNDEILRIVWSFTIFPRWCSRVYHLKLSSKVIRNKRLIVDFEISKERERRCLTEKLFDILSARFHCVFSQGSDADAEPTIEILLQLCPLSHLPHHVWGAGLGLTRSISAHRRRSTGKLANCVQFIAWKSSIYYLVR